jgi:hypothetical protein
MGDLAVGTVVRRDSDNCIGDGSIGVITAIGVDSQCYWVSIIEGKNRMEGWETDAWFKGWCVPVEPDKPSWEV